MRELSILLIGAGGYGSVYLEEITSRAMDCKVAGICDPAPDIRERFPVISRLGIPVYATVTDFYRENGADLAVIVSPVHYHMKQAVECLANGSHVLCEKPLCATPEEAERIQAAAAKAGRFVSVGYQLNYREDVLRLKADILSGILGAPLRAQTVHAVRRGRAYYSRNNWAGRVLSEGRAVYDSPFGNSCAHQFQLMTFLLGGEVRTSCRISRAEAELYRANPDVENFDTAFLRFCTDKGVTICYYTSHAVRESSIGPYGVMEFEKGAVYISGSPPDLTIRMKDGIQADYSRGFYGNDLRKLYDALDCVRNGGVPVCGIQADTAHIEAVCMAQSFPIRQVSPEKVDRYEISGDLFFSIEGIGEIFRFCSGSFSLPEEKGISLSSS